MFVLLYTLIALMERILEIIIGIIYLKVLIMRYVIVIDHK